MAMNVRHSVRFMLQVEGAVIAAAACWLTLQAGPPIWVWVAVLIAPDLSMAAYWLGPRFGAVIYNLAHTIIWPILLIIYGFVIFYDLVIAVGALWAMHIGIDRAVGLGLKYPTGFRHTHLMWKS